jgi:[ribosomal protein S18]-alanine N-acetyltransferase
MNTTGNLRPCWFPEAGWQQALELDHSDFPRPWTTQQWLALNPEQHLLMSWMEQDHCRGFCLFQLLPGDEQAHLLKICIAPMHRGPDFSGRFWQGLLAELTRRSITSIYLEVEETNERAIGFYRRMGFQTLRVARKYYSDGVNALIMQLSL